MSHQTSLRPQFTETIPATLEKGVLYISKKYRTASHLCACGCGARVATPLKPAFWAVSKKRGLVSLSPSIGNWGLPCQSHYWIRDNKVIWAEPFSQRQIADVRARDARDMREYYARRPSFWRRLKDWLW